MSDQHGARFDWLQRCAPGRSASVYSSSSVSPTLSPATAAVCSYFVATSPPQSPASTMRVTAMHRPHSAAVAAVTVACQWHRDVSRHDSQPLLASCMSPLLPHLIHVEPTSLRCSSDCCYRCCWPGERCGSEYGSGCFGSPLCQWDAPSAQTATADINSLSPSPLPFDCSHPPHHPPLAHPSCSHHRLPELRVCCVDGRCPAGSVSESVELVRLSDALVSAGRASRFVAPTAAAQLVHVSASA